MRTTATQETLEAPEAPTLGGVDSKQALFTYWTLGTQGMVGVEFLTGLGQLPEKVFFCSPR